MHKAGEGVPDFNKKVSDGVTTIYPGPITSLYVIITHWKKSQSVSK